MRLDFQIKFHQEWIVSVVKIKKEPEFKNIPKY